MNHRLDLSTEGAVNILKLAQVFRVKCFWTNLKDWLWKWRLHWQRRGKSAGCRVLSVDWQGVCVWLPLQAIMQSEELRGGSRNRNPLGDCNFVFSTPDPRFSPPSPTLFFYVVGLAPPEAKSSKIIKSPKIALARFIVLKGNALKYLVVKQERAIP